MNGPKVEFAALVKSNYMRETPQKLFGTRSLNKTSKNPIDKGTIRREDSSSNGLENPQRLYVRNW